jgi:hypothetical protein
MLSLRYGQHADGKMRMVGDGNADRLKLAAYFVEHLPEILKAFGLWKFGQHCLRVRGAQIYVAQGYNVGQSGVVKIVYDLLSTIPDANARKIDFAARACGATAVAAAAAAASVCAKPHSQSGGSKRHCFQKISS